MTRSCLARQRQDRGETSPARAPDRFARPLPEPECDEGPSPGRWEEGKESFPPEHAMLNATRAAHADASPGSSAQSGVAVVTGTGPSMAEEY